MADIAIELVRTPAQAEHVRNLAWQFIDWLRERYPEKAESINHYLAAQNFENQLDELLEVFTPPHGECLLAVVESEPAGIVMLKPRPEPGCCEMNRMFVSPSVRQGGIGRALCEHLISRARELGYDTLILTALNRHREALRLYRSLGFSEDERADGDDSDNICMRLDIS